MDQPPSPSATASHFGSFDEAGFQRLEYVRNRLLSVIGIESTAAGSTHGTYPAGSHSSSASPGRLALWQDPMAIISSSITVRVVLLRNMLIRLLLAPHRS